MRQPWQLKGPSPPSPSSRARTTSPLWRGWPMLTPHQHRLFSASSNRLSPCSPRRGPNSPLWRGWLPTSTGSSQPHPIVFLSVLQGEGHFSIVERLAPHQHRLFSISSNRLPLRPPERRPLLYCGEAGRGWVSTSTGSSQPHPIGFLSALQGEDHFSIVERLAEAGSPPAQALLNLIQ